MTLPGTRGASGFSIATSRAIGWPFLAITISSPAAARSTSEERLVFASYRFTWAIRSEEHTSELQSLMRISYAVFCLKKKTLNHIHHTRIVDDCIDQAT